MFYRMCICWNLVFFSWLEWGYGFLGEDHRSKVPFSITSSQEYTLSTWLISFDCWCWFWYWADHLPAAVLVRFLHCKEALLSPSSDYTFWKEVCAQWGLCSLLKDTVSTSITRNSAWETVLFSLFIYLSSHLFCSVRFWTFELIETCLLACMWSMLMDIPSVQKDYLLQLLGLMPYKCKLYEVH